MMATDCLCVTSGEGKDGILSEHANRFTNATLDRFCFV